jgi:hypothetical protein
MTAAAATDLEIDIVINNYNYGRYLSDAIASARAQTHPKVRVIVVDDGSGDDSRRVLDELEDGIAVVVLKDNGGQASALNVGVEHCAGDIVMFLDADDVLHPDAAARVAAAFAADEAIARVQFRADVIDAEGRPTGVVKPSPHLPMPTGDLRDAELAHPYDMVWMSTSANAFRSAALRALLPIPETEYRICADWYLVHLSTLLGPVLSLSEVGVSYRMHGANNYEPQSSRLDLDHLRQTILLARSTSAELLRLAAELDLSRPRRILSLADLANRMISLRLEPDRHPIEADGRRRLLADGVVASRRREDVSAAMKLLFLGWFAAMALAPRPLARRLAVLFLFPESRSAANRLLAHLHRGDGPRSEPAVV